MFGTNPQARPGRRPGRGLLSRVLHRVVSVDVRPDALYWAESVPMPIRPRFQRWGKLLRVGGESDAALIGRSQALFDGAEVVLAVGGADLAVERIELAGLSAREARQVASRRAGQLCEDQPEASNADFVVSRGGESPAAWLAACSERSVDDLTAPWEGDRFEIRQIVGLPLAIAALVRWLEAPPAGELIAIFDLNVSFGSCVLADSSGWVFSREIPVKAVAEGGAELSIEDRGERLATELRRTHHYAETQLRLGTVTSLLLSGSEEDPEMIRDQLESRLQLPVQAIGEAIAEGPGAAAPMPAAVAIGLATLAEHSSLDLQGAAVRNARARRWARRRLVFAAAVALLLACAGALHHASVWRSARQQIATVEERWDASEATRRELQDVSAARERAQVVRDLLGRLEAPRPDWTAGLASLGLVLPEDALALGLAVEPEAGAYRAVLNVEFRGIDLASAAESAAHFGRELRGSPLWVVRSSERQALPPAQEPPTSGSRLRYRIEADLAPADTSRPQTPGRQPDA